jgi:hypothetical protein
MAVMRQLHSQSFDNGPPKEPERAESLTGPRGLGHGRIQVDPSQSP